MIKAEFQEVEFTLNKKNGIVGIRVDAGTIKVLPGNIDYIVNNLIQKQLEYKLKKE